MVFYIFQKEVKTEKSLTIEIMYQLDFKALNHLLYKRKIHSESSVAFLHSESTRIFQSDSVSVCVVFRTTSCLIAVEGKFNLAVVL